MFEIRADRLMPLPHRKHGVYSKSSALFPKMAVGDCFSVPRAWRNRLSQAAARYKKRHPGWNYETQTEADETTVWRTA